MDHATNDTRRNHKGRTRTSGNFTEDFIPVHMALAANSGIALAVIVRSVARDGNAWHQVNQVLIPSA